MGGNLIRFNQPSKPSRPRRAQSGPGLADQPEGEPSIINECISTLSCVKDCHRTNVTMKRAKHGLIMVVQHALDVTEEDVRHWS